MEDAAPKKLVRGYGNLLKGMTPAGRWLERDMPYVKPAQAAWRDKSAFIFCPEKRPPGRLRQTQAVCVNNNGSTNQSRRFRVESMKSDRRINFNSSFC
jgi:hypothetical protein